MLIKKVFNIFLLLLIFQLPLFAETARSVMEKSINEIIKVLKEYPGEENKAERRSKIIESLNHSFNYIEMAKRSLGREWKSRSAEERKDFTLRFSKLLQKTYIEKMESYSGEEIIINGEVKLNEKKTQVKTFIQAAQGQIPIDYNLLFKKGKWRVYDVKIEGVGLIKNYRSQFKDILTQNDFKTLLKKLDEKI